MSSSSRSGMPKASTSDQNRAQAPFVYGLWATSGVFHQRGGQVTSKYKRAKSNIGRLKKMGATLLHGIDATQMKHHKDLKMRKFDRIIYNFPHAGFKGKEDDLRLINKHKKLVHGFLRNASHMIRQDGEIHISHKTSFPFCQWKLEELASSNSLVLFKCVDFKIEDYPGYNNKRGDGPRCDLPFPLGECCTFMFQIGKPLRRKRPAPNVADLGGMVFSTPLPQRGSNSNFFPIESDGYALLGRERPPSFVPDYYRLMLSHAGSSERNPNYGHFFLRTETHPNYVPDLPLHAQRPPTAVYRRDAISSWPDWFDREGIIPGRSFHLNSCLPIASGRHHFLGTEGGPNSVPDLLLHTQRFPAAGYSWRDANDQAAWHDHEEGFSTGRSLLQTRHPYLGYATGLEERTRLLPSVISGRFHGGLLQSTSSTTRPEFISRVEDSVRRELREYMSEAPGRTLHDYAAHLQELQFSNAQRVERLKRRLLYGQSP